MCPKVPKKKKITIPENNYTFQRFRFKLAVQLNLLVSVLIACQQMCLLDKGTILAVCHRGGGGAEADLDRKHRAVKVGVLLLMGFNTSTMSLCPRVQLGDTC